MHAADREHVVLCLESFSDIVIAFGLAEIAFNLVIPAHAAMFVTHPIGIVAFVMTFAVVASFRLTHNAIYFELLRGEQNHDLHKLRRARGSSTAGLCAAAVVVFSR